MRPAGGELGETSGRVGHLTRLSQGGTVVIELAFGCLFRCRSGRPIAQPRSAGHFRNEIVFSTDEQDQF